MAESERLVITGVGARTPVGSNAPQSCAALRAGISRIREWPCFAIAGELVPAAAIDPRDLPWTVKGVSPWVSALREAMWHSALYDYSWHAGIRLGLYLATPPRDREGVGPEEYAEFVERAQDAWADATEAAPLTLYSGEHVGGAMALSDAMVALTKGELDVAVVGGLESQLSEPHLAALFSEGRLQVAGRPSGVIPGEAASCMIVESAAHARRRGIKPLLDVVALALETEGPTWSPASPIRGLALSRALDVVLGPPPGAAGVQHVLVDHTGERWRFSEWAFVEARSLSGLPDGWVSWTTADSIGDTGAAFVPLAVARAVAALERRYARPGNFLVTASSIRGERAALVLAPP